MSSLCEQRCILGVCEYLNSPREVVRLAQVSRPCTEAIAEETNAPPDARTLLLWARLSVAACEPNLNRSSPYDPVTAGKYNQTAVLLSPRLWSSSGPVLSTYIEVVVQCHRALGGFSFGVVPEKAFYKDAQQSRLAGFTLDGLGRLYGPKDTKRLYGERLAEGDRLGLLVEGSCSKVSGSYVRNGRNMGVAFSLLADQPYSPVLYFSPMHNEFAVEIVLPQHAVASEHCRGRIPNGLVFKNYGPDMTAWLDIPMDDAAFSKLTVNDTKELLAVRLTDLGPSQVSPVQVEILIDGAFADDNAALLGNLICYRHGMHVENLYWHLPHLTS